MVGIVVGVRRGVDVTVGVRVDVATVRSDTIVGVVAVGSADSDSAKHPANRKQIAIKTIFFKTCIFTFAVPTPCLYEGAPTIDYADSSPS